MTWEAPALARAKEATATIHKRYGETVFIRRLVPTNPDTTYQEDLTRTEREFRLVAVVALHPSPRLLSRYGRTDPADIMFTFSTKLLEDAGVAGGPLDGDIIVYRGLRYTVNQVQQGPKAPGNDQTVINDQLANMVEIPAFGVISVTPNTNITQQVAVTGPAVTALTASTAPGNEKFIDLTLSTSVATQGDPLYRFRVTVNGTLVALASATLLTPTQLRLTAVANLNMLQPIRVTYALSGENPVLNGVTLVGNTQAELQAVNNALVTVT